MKAPIVVALCFVSALTTSAHAQKDLTKTFGLENGRYWNALDEEVRTAYVEGVIHGWTLRQETEDSVDGNVVVAFTSGNVSLTYSELAEMVTAAYRTPDNRTIPIGWVMLAEMAVHRGETTEALVFAALRERVLKMSGKNSTMIGSQASPIDTIEASGKSKAP